MFGWSLLILAFIVFEIFPQARADKAEARERELHAQWLARHPEVSKADAEARLRRRVDRVRRSALYL
jgi:hypothetical protein